MKLKKQLTDWANRYEVPEFINTDPIQFPHRFTKKQDIEISAFVTTYLAFGQRSQILKKVEELHTAMGKSPHEYILTGDFSAFPTGNKKFYRFISYTDMNQLLTTLKSYYSHYADLETAVIETGSNSPIIALQQLFGHIHHIPAIGTGSASKRLCMFLRWVVRCNSPVDLGIWQNIEMSSLMIPLDTHVHRMSLQLGITNRKSADFVTAQEIYDYFKKIFPDDPGRGDFSLFGYSINNKV